MMYILARAKGLAMDFMNGVYWFCLVLGGGFVLVQFILLLAGGVMHGVDIGGGGADLDVPDADAAGSGADFDHAHDPTINAPGVQASHGEYATGASDLHVGPFSPMSIAAFLAGFGGMGLVVDSVNMPDTLGVPAAVFGGLMSLLFGILVSAGLIFTLNKFFENTGASSGYSEGEVIGRAATVSVPMDGKSLGEITYIAGHGTRNSPAKPLDADAVYKQGQEVFIASIEDGIFSVVDLDRALSLKIMTPAEGEIEGGVDITDA